MTALELRAARNYACALKSVQDGQPLPQNKMDLTPVSEISSTTEYEEERDMLGILQPGKNVSTSKQAVKIIKSI